MYIDLGTYKKDYSLPSQTGLAEVADMHRG